MIDNYDSVIHQGLTPVRVLEQNIVAWFELLSPSVTRRLQALTEESKVEPNFRYWTGAPVLIPGIGADRVIELHEGFCGYVWMMSYSVFVLSQSFFGSWEGREDQATRGQSALNLHSYSKQIQSKYLDWHTTGLPNPEKYEDLSPLREDISIANAIYVSAMALILCHECAHGYFDHTAVVEGVLERKRDREREADAFAVEMFQLAISEVETPKSAALQFGLIVAFCAILFLSGPGTSGTHPDPFDRLSSALEKLGLDPDSALWAYAIIGVSLWAYQNQPRIHVEGVGTVRENYYELIRQVRNGL